MTTGGLQPQTPNGAQARHQSQPSAISATPATQSEGQCYQVTRLSKLCVSKLCVRELCVRKLYVSCV